MQAIFFFFTQSGDVSVDCVTYDCIELSELRNEVCGKCRFGKRWLVNVMRNECFAGVKN